MTASTPHSGQAGVRLDGYALRDAREAAGLTLARLAEELRLDGIGPGFSPSRLSLVETRQDHRPVGEWQAQVLATAVRRPLSSLLRYPARLDPPLPGPQPAPPPARMF